ncbi:MAG TPA: isoprenylcysteine carboxylmethyltransferase family protein [Candidatus Deferrimicrobium sp.]|nr:isoprenylcysteine carboxylmethyltransferase family protein [Candidatus Deferrimicrobium sp.]
MEPLVYRSAAAAAVVAVTVLLWWVSELRIAVRNRGGTGENLDRGSRLWVVALVAAGTATAFWLARREIGIVQGWWPIAVGILLAMCGIALRAWSVATLGAFFTTAVEVQPHHRIVDDGPYRLLRHPSYTGALVTVVGVTLALGSWPGCLAATGLTVAGLVQRIVVEERALAVRLGPAWGAFARSRRRLIPMVW